MLIVPKISYKLRIIPNLRKYYRTNAIVLAVPSDEADANNAKNENKKRYIYVPFPEKDLAKGLGALWDGETKQWYVPEYRSMEDFQRWSKVYLSVPYEQRDIVKQKGALWHAAEKKWFTTQGSQDEFEAWIKTPSKFEPMKPIKQLGFFDIETNGLPIRTDANKSPQFDELDKYENCRIVKLSYLICNKKTMAKIEGSEIIIRPDNFEINNSEYHGVTQSIALEKGKPFKEAAKIITAKLKASDLVLSHCANFDINVMKSELLRYNMVEELELFSEFPVFCTMEGTKNIIRLRDTKSNVKNPSLKELYNFATGKEKLDSSQYSNLEALYEAIKSLTLTNVLKLDKVQL